MFLFILQDDEDNNYEEEAEVADEFDSDFDEDVGDLFSFYALK